MKIICKLIKNILITNKPLNSIDNYYINNKIKDFYFIISHIKNYYYC